MQPEDYFNNCIGVFQGGGCKAIAYIGAYKKARELGIMFSEVAGTSAGSIIAAMIAIGCPPQKLEKIIEDTDFKELSKRAKFEGSWLLRLLIDILSFIFSVIIGVLITPFIICRYIYSFTVFTITWILKKGRKRRTPTPPKFKLFKNYYNVCLIISAILNGHWGLFDSKIIQRKVEEWFELCGVSKNITFGELNIQLHVVATDVFNHQAKIWSSLKTPEVQIAKAVAASCSIPVFFTPIDKKYVDGGIISNRPDFLFYENEHKYTKILSFSLEGSNYHYHKRFEFLKELINTIIDGSDKLQHDMLPQILDKIIIQHGDIEATSFDKISPDKINELINYGQIAVEKFIKNQTQENLCRLITQSKGKIISRDRMYTQVASWSLLSPEKVIIYEPTLDWVWSLFPTLISWINSGTKIVVYRQDHEWEKSKTASYKEIKTKYECDNTTAKDIFKERIEIRDSRKRLLDLLGCKVKPYKFNRIKGFFFKFPQVEFIGIGIKYPEKYNRIFPEKDITAKIYTDPVDSALLTEQITALKVNDDFNNMGKPSHCDIIQNNNIRLEIENRLHNISYYQNASFAWEKVKLNKLIFLNSRLRGFKYTQDIHIFNLYNGKKLFDASAITLVNGKLSYMSPIVIEEHDNKLYVIKGNTRSLYAWKHGIKQLTVLVIRGVTAKLPINGDIKGFGIEELFVSEEPISGTTRYGNNFQKALFRPIEEYLRPISSYLK